MGAPENFFKDLQNYLHASIVSTAIFDTSTSAGGRGKINVGENFDLSLRITNTAPGSLSEAGTYTFKNITVIMARTNDGFAVPLHDTGAEAEFVELPLNPGILRAGQSGIVQFSMKAKRNMGGFLDWFMQEEVGKVSIRADFDYNSYFHITSIPVGFSLEIEP
jgi:hypothetical protein